MPLVRWRYMEQAPEDNKNAKPQHPQQKQTIDVRQLNHGATRQAEAGTNANCQTRTHRARIPPEVDGLQGI